MTAEFDPYYYFLGIGRKHQPADHYRILGVEQFEPNIEIIEMAADRQMAHLHRHEASDHSDDVAKLMNEVSRARLCLLNPSKRATYDAELRDILDADAAVEQEVTLVESPQEPEDGQQRRIVVLDDVLDQITSTQAIAQEQLDSLWNSLDLDRGIDRHKAEMLFEINDAIAAHRASAPGWQEIFVRAIAHHVLADLKSFGEIDDDEGNWLVEKISQDKRLDSNELALLAELKSRTGGDVGGRLRRMLEKFADKLPAVEANVLKDDPTTAATYAEHDAIDAEVVTETQDPGSQTEAFNVPAVSQLSNESATSLVPPSIPDSVEPSRQLASPFSKTLAERARQTCHFCGQRQSSDETAVKRSMYGNVQRTETGWNTYQATWENTEVTVPRCAQCNKHHHRINKAMCIGALLGLVPGALGFLSILSIGGGGVCVGLSLALIGALIGAVVAFAIASSETPYKMKIATDVKGFERIQNLQVKGWKCGKKPSQQDQRTAPIASEKGSEQSSQSSGSSGTQVGQWESACPKCGHSSYTMRAHGECPRCGTSADLTAESSKHTCPHCGKWQTVAPANRGIDVRCLICGGNYVAP